MAKTRKEYLRELIEVAQEGIWKNELFLKYNKDLPEDKIKAAQEYIKRDEEYINFLRGELK